MTTRGGGSPRATARKIAGPMGLLLGACASPPPSRTEAPEPPRSGAAVSAEAATATGSAAASAASPPGGCPAADPSALAPADAPVASAFTALGPSTPGSTPPARCPADMVDVERACIDRYEAPNQAGSKPLLMQSQTEASRWCAERGKRLCTEDEWLRACRGPEGRKYPYGNRYDEHACNQDKPFIPPRWKTLGAWPSEAARAEAARLDQSEPSGSRPGCVTPEGVFDLTANAAEWVKKSKPHPEACLTPEQQSHEWVVMGCYWGKCYRKPHEPACDYVNCSHPAGFRSYEFGFRCCRDRQP